MPDDKRFDLGVLLVHGIGTQASGELLIGWGDEILNGIRLATREHVRPVVERGAIPTDDVGRAEMEVRLGDDERWLFAEGWWAQSFRAPTYGELVSWGFRALPWALAIRAAQRYWQAKQGTAVERFLESCRASGLLFLGLAVSPLFILVLTLTLLLGLIPIPQLRSIILSVQSVLTATLGDSLAFVESPVRAGLIRTRVLEAMAYVADRCKRTIVVAHSQGAAVVLHALGGIRIEGAEERAAPPAPNTLVTFGAGINQLVSLGVLGRTVTDNPAYWGLGAIASTAALIGWFYHALTAHILRATQILSAAGLCFLGIFALMLLWAGRVWVFETARQWPILFTIGAVPASLAIVGGIVFLIKRGSLPIAQVILLGAAAFILAMTFLRILSDSMKEAVSKPVKKPDGVERWLDLYASDDPVPNGPILTEQNDAVESTQIFNRGSIFEDHNAYWENRDGFVLRVIRECARTAESRWSFHLADQVPQIDARGQWRIQYLRIVRWATGAFWFPILAMLWLSWGERVWVPEDASRLIPATAITWLRFSVLLIAVAFAAWLVGSLLQLPWKWWTRYEQKQFLSRKDVTGTPWSALVGMGMFVWLFLMLVWWAVFPDWKPASGVEDFLFLSLGYSLLSMLLLRLFLRPPKTAPVPP